MAKLFKKYQPYLSDKQYWFLIATAIFWFICSLVVTYFATNYSTRVASTAVTDLILNNTPVIDVSWVFIYGPIAFWLIVAGYVFGEPKKIPFTIKSIAVFLFTRSISISLTHLGTFYPRLHTDTMFTSHYAGFISLGNDYFFSGHTGLPFLMALVFWDNKRLRYFCLVSSVIFGVAALLGHLHYSIDVFAAYFITYGVYRITQYLFQKDHYFFHFHLPAKN